MKGSFQDKVVVVTGGASGIGDALVKAFVREGALFVAVLDLVIPREKTSGGDSRIGYFECDVTNSSRLEEILNSIKHQYQQIDIYCSNAGIVFSPSDDNDDKVTRHSNQEWNKILQVNLVSHVTALRLLLPDWEKGQGDGIFCMTASAAGLLTMVGDASYGVSKAAAISLAEHMAISHADTLQVHCLCPQAVDTPFVKETTKANNAAMTDGMISPEYVAECTLQAIQAKEFFIFPHAKVQDYVERKAMDHKRWLKGMQRLRDRLVLKSKL